MLDEDSRTVLEKEKECEQKRMRQDNLKGGGGAAWGQVESANENQIWAARRFGFGGTNLGATRLAVGIPPGVLLPLDMQSVRLRY